MRADCHFDIDPRSAAKREWNPTRESGVYAARYAACTTAGPDSAGPHKRLRSHLITEMRKLMIQRHGRSRHRRVGRLRKLFAPMLGLLAMVGTVYAAAPAGGRSAPVTGAAPTTKAEADALPGLRELEARVERVNQGWARLAGYYDSEVAPVERVLLRYRSDDEALVGRIATAVVREAKAAGIDPRLLLAVLLVENPWLEPEIRSSVGAVGLMQVMPVHRGGWSCGYDLEDIDTNVCLGAQVFAHYLDRTGADLEKALLRYNGCVTGSNTPNCHQYPSRVLAHADAGASEGWRAQGAASP